MKHLPVNKLSSYGSKKKTLGKGTYGRVDQYGDYAVKFFIKEEPELGVIDDALIEIGIMTKICCECNVIPIVDAGITEDHIPYMVLPLAKYGTILHYGQKLSVEDKLIVIHQMIKGVAVIHQHGILHKDLKPSNILVMDKPTPNGCEVVISDFGLSYNNECSSGSKKDNQGMTARYAAPERLYDGNYSYPSDIWSLAVTIYEFFTGILLFDQEKKMMIYEISQYLGPINEKTWPGVSQYPKYKKRPQIKKPTYIFKRERDTIHNDQLFDLLSKMLVLDPSKRITALQALNHPLFESMNTDLSSLMGTCQSKMVNYMYPNNYSSGMIDILYNIGTNMFGLKLTTVVQAFHLFDRYIKIKFNKTKIALATSIAIASKIREGSYPGLFEIFDSLRIELDRDVIIYEEEFMIKVLKFNLYDDTYLDLLLTYNQFYNKDIRKMSKCILLLMYLTDAIKSVKGTTIVISSLYMSCKMYSSDFKHSNMFTSDPDAQKFVDKCIIEFDKISKAKTYIEKSIISEVGMSVQGLLQTIKER